MPCPVERCSVCPGDSNVVLGDGPTPCHVCFIGEAPGFWEDRRRKPFVGETGKELDRTYLPLAGLRRDEVFITNTRKCQPPNNRKPSDKEIRACGSHFLPDELRDCDPEVVVLMGATACAVVDKDSGQLDLEKHHGIPLKRTIYGREYWVFATYHPAAGLRGMTVGGEEGAGPVPVMELLLEDFEKLGRVIGGEREEPRDNIPTHYELVEDPLFIRDLLRPDIREVPLPLAVDRESEDDKPWSWQFSGTPGIGFMFLTSNKACTQAFGEHSRKYKWILHNADDDLDAAQESFGFEPAEWEDTMRGAYRLQNQPQSLKRLAYRLCGMEMQSYNDLVMPYARRAVQEWLANALTQLPDVIEHYVTPKKKLERTRRKPHPAEKVVRRLFRHTRKSDEYDPWARWLEVDEQVREAIVVAAGSEMPRPRISQVPIREVVEYGCRDADATLRCFHAMTGEIEGFGQDVRERDWSV